jgi:hypothetical protein
LEAKRHVKLRSKTRDKTDDKTSSKTCNGKMKRTLMSTPDALPTEIALIALLLFKFRV